jgi:hypothetical protein
MLQRNVLLLDDLRRDHEKGQREDARGRTRKRERGPHALLALAATKAFIMWKSSSFICATITDGEYTPAAVTAAPKMAPEAIDFRVVQDISAASAALRTLAQGGDVWEMEREASYWETHFLYVRHNCVTPRQSPSQDWKMELICGARWDVGNDVLLGPFLDFLCDGRV